MKPKKITELEASKLIGISTPALCNIRKRGEGPPFYAERIPGVPGAHRGHYLNTEVIQWARKRKWSTQARGLLIKTNRKGK